MKYYYLIVRIFISMRILHNKAGYPSTKKWRSIETRRRTRRERESEEEEEEEEMKRKGGGREGLVRRIQQIMQY